jgi:hypothetical protein
MELNPGLGNVCCIAVVREPEVFNEVVAEGFEDAAVEFVAGGIGRATQGKLA